MGGARGEREWGRHTGAYAVRTGISGDDVSVQEGPSNGFYVFIHNTGRVEVTGFGLDLGGVYCAGNTRQPIVRGIAAETPGVLQGQRAGRGAFSDSDF